MWLSYFCRNVEEAGNSKATLQTLKTQKSLRCLEVATGEKNYVCGSHNNCIRQCFSISTNIYSIYAY